MTVRKLLAPRKLERTDDRSSFTSGASELDTWLARYAWQNQQANNSVTYVATFADGAVVGYYALCTAAVSKADAPHDFAKGRPRDIPCILLARLAVDARYQGLQIGRHLFADAVRRAVAASDAGGAAALLIHARMQLLRASISRRRTYWSPPLTQCTCFFPSRSRSDSSCPPSFSAAGPLTHDGCASTVWRQGDRCRLKGQAPPEEASTA